MTKKFIGIIPNLETKQIVIAPWKTMEEAIEFARKMFGFNWNNMKKAKNRENTWIGVMYTKSCITNNNTKIYL